MYVLQLNIWRKGIKCGKEILVAYEVYSSKWISHHRMSNTLRRNSKVINACKRHLDKYHKFYW